MLGAAEAAAAGQRLEIGPADAGATVSQGAFYDPEGARLRAELRRVHGATAVRLFAAPSALDTLQPPEGVGQGRVAPDEGLVAGRPRPRGRSPRGRPVGARGGPGRPGRRPLRRLRRLRTERRRRPRGRVQGVRASACRRPASARARWPRSRGRLYVRPDRIDLVCGADVAWFVHHRLLEAGRGAGLVEGDLAPGRPLPPPDVLARPPGRAELRRRHHRRRGARPGDRLRARPPPRRALDRGAREGVHRRRRLGPEHHDPGGPTTRHRRASPSTARAWPCYRELSRELDFNLLLTQHGHGNWLWRTPSARSRCSGSGPRRTSCSAWTRATSTATRWPRSSCGLQPARAATSPTRSSAPLASAAAIVRHDAVVWAYARRAEQLARRAPPVHRGDWHRRRRRPGHGRADPPRAHPAPASWSAWPAGRHDREDGRHPDCRSSAIRCRPRHRAGQAVPGPDRRLGGAARVRSQSARGELVIGAEIDPYTSYSRRSTLAFMESRRPTSLELFPPWRS